jgi:lipooligosaccharide transport system ATP-binding protein
MNVETLCASGLRKSYKGREVVRGVDLCIEPGRITSLLGPNGAGKTTTVGMLYGGVLATSGTVTLGGSEVRSDIRSIRAKFGIVTQDNNLDQDVTVEENLVLFAHHYRMDYAAAKKRALELLEMVGLKGEEKKMPDELSGGMQRRLVFARALIHNPQFVFLDEPTTGLDPDARQEFWKLISGLREREVGVLLTTHYMDEAQRLSDTVLLMQKGKIIDSGAPEELIGRHAGEEVVEIEGVSGEKVAELVQRFSTWICPFGVGVIVGLPQQRLHEFWLALEGINSGRLSRRRANLDDVFLRLTGSGLASS